MFAPITAEPGSSRNYKTGSWRMGLKPRFLRQNCIACNMCAIICPEGIVEGEGKNTYHTDYRFCKGCGLCAEVCPKDDIVMVPEGE